MLNKTTLLKILVKLTSKIENKQEWMALLVHSIMLAVGFRLVGLDEDERLSTEGKQLDLERLEQTVEPLPDHWNHKKNYYSFTYKHEQSSMTFLIKCMRLAEQLLITALAIEDGKIHQMQFDMKQLNQLEFPITDFSITNLLTKFPKLDDFVYDFKVKILVKMVPGLDKVGYERSEEQSNATSSTSRPPQTQPPEGIFPERPSPLMDPRFRYPQNVRPPFSIGDQDLDPFSSLGPPHAGGGMILGPDHPMFGGAHRSPEQSFLPPGMVPPGARYDPVTPFGTGRPPFPRPRPNPRAPGEPDNDELMPPGAENMYY